MSHPERAFPGEMLKEKGAHCLVSTQLSDTTFVSVDGITKSFNGNVVLSDVSLDIASDSFHALVGENGAGKSTLINLVSGIYIPDSGSISIDGERMHAVTPGIAVRKGISVVHQELSLFPHLTVAENIFQGRELVGRLGILQKKRMNEKATQLLEEINIGNIDPRMSVGRLSLAEQQIVEFVKALYQQPKLLILDEATSALDPKQVDIVFEHLRKRRSEVGLSIIFISHRLGEVFDLCDTITVLKDGRHIVTESTERLGVSDMITYMTGRKIADIYPPKRPPEEIYSNEQVLQADHLYSERLNDISFSLYKSEVLGIGGLQGQGQSELMEALFGATPIVAGGLIINGEKFGKLKPIESMNNGVAYIPAERKTEGLYLPFSIKDNISTVNYEKVSNKLFGIINQKAEITVAEKGVKTFGIRCTGPMQTVRSLSGGNQQKVVLAKWLEREPTIMLLNEPTRGIDVGTKKEIYEIIRQLAEKGVSIIVISSDTTEMLGICDRVIVLYENRINAVLTGSDLTESKLVHASVLKMSQELS